MMNAVIFVILEGRQVDINVIDYIHYVFCIHPVYGYVSSIVVVLIVLAGFLVVCLIYIIMELMVKFVCNQH